MSSVVITAKSGGRCDLQCHLPQSPRTDHLLRSQRPNPQRVHVILTMQLVPRPIFFPNVSDDHGLWHVIYAVRLDIIRRTNHAQRMHLEGSAPGRHIQQLSLIEGHQWIPSWWSVQWIEERWREQVQSRIRRWWKHLLQKIIQYQYYDVTGKCVPMSSARWKANVKPRGLNDIKVKYASHLSKSSTILCACHSSTAQTSQ